MCSQNSVGTVYDISRNEERTKGPEVAILCKGNIGRQAVDNLCFLKEPTDCRKTDTRTGVLQVFPCYMKTGMEMLCKFF